MEGCIQKLYLAGTNASRTHFYGSRI